MVCAVEKSKIKEIFIIFLKSSTVFVCFSSIAEFLTWLKVTLKPSPNTVHYILTHFRAFWNIINNIPFLRDAVMRYVLTCKYKSRGVNSSRRFLKWKCLKATKSCFVVFFSLISTLPFNWKSPNLQHWLWLQELGSLFQSILLHTDVASCSRGLPNTYGSCRWASLSKPVL